MRNWYRPSNKPSYRHSKSRPLRKSVRIIKQANLQAFEKSTIEKVCMYHQTSQATGIRKVDHWKSLYVSSNKPIYRHSKSQPFEKSVCIIKQANLQAFEKSTIEKVCMYHQTSQSTGIRKVSHLKSLYVSLNKPIYRHSKSQPLKKSVCIIKQAKLQAYEKSTIEKVCMCHQTSQGAGIQKVHHWKRLCIIKQAILHVLKKSTIEKICTNH